MSANELSIPISKLSVIGLRTASHKGMARGRKIPDLIIKIDAAINSTDPMIHKLSSIPPIESSIRISDVTLKGRNPGCVRCFVFDSQRI